MGTLLEMYEQKIKSFISEVNIKSQPFIEQLRNEEEVEKRINFIKKELTELDEKAVTNEHIKTALFNTLDSFFSSKLPQFYYPIKQEMISSDQYLDQLKNIINRFFNEICSEIKRLDYLTLLKGKNIIIVGGNGVGKSTFASYLKQSASENIIIIPAQKYLYVYTKSGNSNLTISIPEVKRSLNNDIGLLGRTDENMYNFDRENSQVFTKSITAIVNDHLSQLDKDNSREVITRTKTQLIELEEVWKTIFPDIVLQRDTDFRSLFVMQNGFEYSVNAMSEGEKSVLFYLLQILFAPENSYVVIDEPETYLNPVISNRLWNKLESIRSDVKFVYISHSINFIASRQEANLIWIKNFTHPDNWNFQELETLHNQLPRELISELTGTKNLLFLLKVLIRAQTIPCFLHCLKRMLMCFLLVDIEMSLNTQGYITKALSFKMVRHLVLLIVI
ncbi:ATP-binding protein [Leuconostoc lactis]|nr:ATP-binding protein [Leuconostoc lactis]